MTINHLRGLAACMKQRHGTQTHVWFRVDSLMRSARRRDPTARNGSRIVQVDARARDEPVLYRYYYAQVYGDWPR